MSIFKKGFAAMGRRKRRERGIALIFTLGILGLLTVLALGFASTAMLNSKISGNISHQQKARYIARLGAERALYALTQCPDIPISNIFSKSSVIYSWEEGSEDRKMIEKRSCDGIWKLNTKLNGIPIYEITDDYGADSVGWEYIRDPQSDTNSKSKKNDIIGRYAYVIAVEKGGKLDPSVHLAKVDSNDIGAEPSRNGTINDTLSFKVPFRSELESKFQSTDDKLLYKLMQRIFYFSQRFYNTYQRRFFDFGNLLKYKYENDGADKIKKGDTNIFSKEGITSSRGKAKWTRKLGNILGVRPAPYQECYTLSSTTGSTTTTNTYPRFNLNRSDWDSLTPEELVDQTKLSSGDAIAWLVNWTHSRGTTDEWTAERMKKQIAANIIQYSRPMEDNINTIADSENWETTLPTYAGIGEHPMLNEIGVKLNIRADAGEDPTPTEGTTTYSPKYTIEADIGVELIDMFKLSSYREAQVSVYGSLSFAYTKPTGISDSNFIWEPTYEGIKSTGDSTPLCTITISSADWSNGYSVKWYIGSGSESGNSLISESFPDNLGSFPAEKGKSEDVLRNMRVKDIKMNISKVILKVGEQWRDCAIICNDSSLLKTGTQNYQEEHVIAPFGEEKKWKSYYFLAAWQAVDPRVNHYPIDWTLKLSDPSTAVESSYPGTPGEKNPFDGYIDNEQPYINATTDGDKEAVSDPAWTSDNQHLASAYIRHAKMESLWELGCISRAEPWKTLNLKRSNPLALGGETYAKGDANILDQVKITDAKSRFGLINLNTDEHFVLEPLFYKIPFYKNLYDSTGLSPASILDVKRDQIDDTQRPGYLLSEKDSSHDADECLACLIKKRASVLPFENRSDLLMDYSDPETITALENAGKIDSTQKTALQTISNKICKKLLEPTATGVTLTTDAEEEQLVGKIMNLVATEPYETVYIIAVGQSIRDIGSSDNKGITIFKNWAGSGKADKTYRKSDATKRENDAHKAYRRAGYIRPFTLKEIEDGDSSPKVLNGAPNQLEDKITDVKKGQYDLGADKICAESKIVMTLCFDPWTKKWKIKRFEYVE